MTCKGNKILGNKEISGTEFAESPLVDGRYPPGKTGNPAGCNAVPIRMEPSSSTGGTVQGLTMGGWQIFTKIKKQARMAGLSQDSSVSSAPFAPYVRVDLCYIITYTPPTT